MLIPLREMTYDLSRVKESLASIKSVSYALLLSLCTSVARFSGVGSVGYPRFAAFCRSRVPITPTVSDHLR